MHRTKNAPSGTSPKSMNDRFYTAQEMREAAEYAVVEKRTKYGVVRDSKKTKAVADMLRQAAEMRERCEREIARLPYPPNGDDDVYMFKMLNRILRGDAEKEKK